MLTYLYFQDNKVVVLEDLASHFRLKTQNVIDRIQDLQNDGILTGKFYQVFFIKALALGFGSANAANWSPRRSAAAAAGEVQQGPHNPPTTHPQRTVRHTATPCSVTAAAIKEKANFNQLDIF